MRRGIIFGSILVVLIIMILPITSLAESQSAKERIELQENYLKQTRENIFIKPHEPACILRLLLWLRNLIGIGIIAIILLILRGGNNSTA